MDLVKPFIEHILYPVMEKYKGNQIRYNISELQQSQKLKQYQLRRMQNEKLKKLLLECIAHVSAYQSFANLRNHIESDALNALSNFPVLDKKTYRKNPNAYLNQTVSKNHLIANRTGSSTGEPVRFFIDRSTVEYYEAARWRGLSWWGISPGSRSVMIWILAYQCINRNMHISAENAIMEVVDSKMMQPLPFGQSGLLLVTDLNNFSMRCSAAAEGLELSKTSPASKTASTC